MAWVTAVAWVRSLGWELSHAVDAAKNYQKKKKPKKTKKNKKTFVITEVLHFLVTAPSVFDKAVKKSIIYIRQSLNILF